MVRPSICIVTPATSADNNGNWQTASRWARMLSDDYRLRVLQRWDGEPADGLLALHARRSAESVARWAAARPGAPLAVVLTGTDLYRDLAAGDGHAARSLALADRLVVLHELAVRDLPAAQRRKARVLLQSAPARRTLVKTTRRLRVLMVGHLRAEKAPETFFEAARLLDDRSDILFEHVGAALTPALGRSARALMRATPHYRWLGALPHAATRARIQRAHVLVQASRMEGGAHTVIEALQSGTPVLASRIAGNLGVLGRDYRGCFAPGDAAGLATLLARCRDEPAILQALRAQCAARAPLFEPARERATLLEFVDAWMHNRP